MRTETEIEVEKKRASGVALMLSILMLIAVSALAISTLQTATSDNIVAGFQSQETAALYAAEAGIADARRLVRTFGSVGESPEYPADFPNEDNPVALATATDFNFGKQQPTFFIDPNVNSGDAIQFVGPGKQCIEGCNAVIGRGAPYFHTKWQINVVGESSSGDQKRLEVVATRLLSSN